MKKITLITFLILLMFNVRTVLSQATSANNPTDATLLTELGGVGITLSNATLENGNRFFQLATFSNGLVGAGLEIYTGVLITKGSVDQVFSQQNTELQLSFSSPTDLIQNSLFINNGFDLIRLPGPPVSYNTNSVHNLKRQVTFCSNNILYEDLYSQENTHLNFKRSFSNINPTNLSI